MKIFLPTGNCPAPQPFHGRHPKPRHPFPTNRSYPMSEQAPRNVKQGSHFTALDYGPPAQWKDIRLNHPRLGEVRGKTFLREPLGLTGSEVSLSSLAPGVGVPFL